MSARRSSETTRSKPAGAAGEDAGAGRIRVGIGGWTYEPWRETFYPAELPARQALAYASRRLSAIEVNGTFYRLQTPKTFAQWREETPDDFVFALKAPRFVTHRKRLADAGEGLRRFVDSGIAELGAKLGPLLWQLPPTHAFDAADCRAFLRLLPTRLGGRALRHVLEVRHDSFLVPEYLALLREYRVAAVYTDSPDYPSFSDRTADFVYARLMRAEAARPSGYSAAALRRWAAVARAWSRGESVAALPRIDTADSPGPADVHVFFINGAKARAPAAAMALRAQLGEAVQPSRERGEPA